MSYLVCTKSDKNVVNTGPGVYNMLIHMDIDAIHYRARFIEARNNNAANPNNHLHVIL